MREMVIVKVTGGLWKGNDTSTSYLLDAFKFIY